jgi:hypothetical protein
MSGGRSWLYSMSRYLHKPSGRVVLPSVDAATQVAHFCCVVINIRHSVTTGLGPDLSGERERESIEQFRRKDSTLALISPRRKNSTMVIICATYFFLTKYPMPYCTTFNMPERRYSAQDVTLKVKPIALLYRAIVFRMSCSGWLAFFTRMKTQGVLEAEITYLLLYCKCLQ